jgi:hypothetical protein
MDFNAVDGIFLVWYLGAIGLSVLLAPFRKRTSDANIAPLLAYGIATAASAVISWLKGRGTKAAEEDARALENARITGNQALAESIIARATANGFDPTGAQTGTQTSSGTSGSTSTQNSTTSSKPVITAEYQPMEEQLRGLIEGRLGKGQFSNEEFVNRTLANRIRATNRTYANATANAENRVARQGGGALKGFGATTPINTARAGQIADTIGNAPLEARALENQDLDFARGAIGAFGTGSQSKTKGTTNTSGWNTGSATTTTPPNLGALYSMLRQDDPKASTNTGFSPGLQAGGDLLSSLMALWANKNQGGGSKAGGSSGGGVYDSNGNYIGE